MEKTVKHFCTTASRIKKDAVRSVKAANIAIGISAITIGKMKLEQLKKKLPNINISIDYTGTWKDSLQLGLGIVTTGGGLLLTLASGGSEIASVGSSSAISIPAAAEGIGIAGSGLAISFDALRNMFDVRIQKSESSKGNGVEKNAGADNYGKSMDISKGKMYQQGQHYNKHGRDMGYSSKAEYEKAVREFFEQNRNTSEIYEGVWNSSRGSQSGQRQIIMRQDGKQLIINKESGQIIDFYEGTSLDGFVNIERMQ